MKTTLLGVVFSYLFLVITLFVINVYFQVVTNNAELQNAISSASAGTTIELADGTWTDVQISINVNATELQTCIIKAQILEVYFSKAIMF